MTKVKSVDAIVTAPPYAPFLEEVLAHPIVSGIRLNTVMPLKETHEEALARLNATATSYNKKLWVDLKGRQLRVATYCVPPFTEVLLTHDISLKTPTTAYFSDGAQQATVVGAVGNKLLLLDGPRRVVGPGESVNIPDSSLHIDGYFTTSDLAYIDAAKKLGINDIMLSFVEGKEDITALLEKMPNAQPVAKIESMKGLRYVRDEWNKEARLMAARGDLYLEVPRPHLVGAATESIVRKDNNAIVASRIFGSLAQSPVPTCADIGDAENLLRMGYRTFMFGDDICLRRDNIISGLNLLEEMSKEYARRTR